MSTQPDSVCKYCGAARSEFRRNNLIKDHGEFTKHQYLCLGLNANGIPLGVPSRCLKCDAQFANATIDANIKHYNLAHKIKINATCTLRDLQHRFKSHLFPSLNFNNDYGSYYTQRNVIKAHKDLARWWQLSSEQPVDLEYESHEILGEYQVTFEDYFGEGVVPISLHAHVSDVNQPHLICSLVRHVLKFDQTFPQRRLSEHQIKQPQLSVLEGTYGSGYGTQGWVSVWYSDSGIQAGIKPKVISMKNSRKQVEDSFLSAKNAGCVGFVVEIVRSSDLKILPASDWVLIAKQCVKHQIFLIVDESVTAIRCGAPFAHQRPEYANTGFKPDLIFFGKGLRIAGIALDFGGSTIRKLQIRDPAKRQEVIIHWRKLFTAPAAPMDLIQPIGTLRLAIEERWHERAIAVGKVLRDIVLETCPTISTTHIGGLDSLLYFRASDVQATNVIPAGTGTKKIRWLPTLDEAMSSREELMAKVFGIGSRLHRSELALYMQENSWLPIWCSKCGEISDSTELCMTCAISFCDGCRKTPHICIS